MTKPRYKPPDFTQSLHRGLGRALQDTIKTGRLGDEEAVLDACLHNRSYDQQVEGSRADWMMEILTAANFAETFRPTIVAAMNDTKDFYDLGQLCDFARHFAAAGDDEARAALYDGLERRPISSAFWMAEDQIVELDGVDGLLHVARQRDPADPDPIHFSYLVEIAEESEGMEAVQERLVAAKTTTPVIQSYFDYIEERQSSAAKRKGFYKQRPDAMRDIPLDQVMSHIDQAKDKPLHRPYLVHWGNYVDESQRLPVLERLTKETLDPSLILCLKVFSKRRAPRFEPRLLDLADSPNFGVRYWAFRALRHFSRDDVRDLALSRLPLNPKDQAIALFTNNYRAGDAVLIAQALTFDPDPVVMHDLVGEMLEVFEANPFAEAAEALHFAYEQGPCSRCRGRAVDLLIKTSTATAALLEECRYDANPDNRERVLSH